jgi:Virulence activator alpha C-term
VNLILAPHTLAHLSAYRAYLKRRLESYEQIEARLADSPPGYPEHVLRHGLTRVRATLAWIDETTAAIESDVSTTSRPS